MYQNPVPYIDTNLSDEDLITQWNELWFEYGWMRGEWIDEWLGDRVFYDDRFW